MTKKGSLEELWDGACLLIQEARMEVGRTAFKILTGAPTVKRSLGRPRRIWVTILEWI